MDTTMQSPIRWKIPLPYFAGIEGPDFGRPEGPDSIEVPIPSGPHAYSNKTWIGRVPDGITPKQAFEVLSRHATPFQGGAPSVDGGTVEIPILGKVRQIVDPDRLTIVNTTEPHHILYPGNVHRSIVQEGDDLYVVTQGYGTGIFPRLNEKLAPKGWTATDIDIRNELNPSPTPAFAPDAVYSPMGDFYGNFPSTPGTAAVSPMSFNPAGNGVGPRTAGFNASAPGFSQLMSAGQFPASNPFLPAAAKPRTPFNDYGTQPQPTAGQIGDGNGISPFSAGLAGINPDEPAPPIWPPQPSVPVRYLTSRVVQTPETPGDKPVRYLGWRTYNPSQGSPFGPPASAASPAPPEGPLSINDAYLEYRRRLDANQSQASAIDAGSPAAPAAPSDDLYFSGGLPGRIAALAGIDPRNPGQFAPSPLDDQLRAFYRDDPAWFLQLRR
jgi:hypothetical protein